MNELIFHKINIHKILQVVLEADEGPELDTNTGGVLDTRLVVKPIKEAFGIPIIRKNCEIHYIRFKYYFKTTLKCNTFLGEKKSCKKIEKLKKNNC